MKISDQTSISMPMRNLISIVAAVAVGVWAYFGVIERLNNLETKAQLSEKDLQQVEQRLGADIDKNNEFRIKWPRGELGSPPADSEQFMLIEHIAMQVEKIQERMENMINNGKETLYYHWYENISLNANSPIKVNVLRAAITGKLPNVL